MRSASWATLRCSKDHRELLAQNRFACRCHPGEHQVFVAQVVRWGYSSLGEEDNSLGVLARFVSRSAGVLPCR